MEIGGGVRIDKFLWATRLYKSRTLAANACQAGHVRIAGQHVKASRQVRPGEIITALAGSAQRTIKVITLLERRVGASRVREFLEDLTPPEEYARARAAAFETRVLHPKGFGRPTKKQRRQIVESKRLNP